MAVVHEHGKGRKGIVVLFCPSYFTDREAEVQEAVWVSG